MLSAADFERISWLSGRAIAVVFGGGGARGFAHLRRTIMAFEEEGIPIDIIGGTSSGAFIGPCTQPQLPEPRLSSIQTLR